MLSISRLELSPTMSRVHIQWPMNSNLRFGNYTQPVLLVASSMQGTGGLVHLFLTSMASSSTWGTFKAFQGASRYRSTRTATGFSNSEALCLLVVRSYSIDLFTLHVVSTQELLLIVLMRGNDVTILLRWSSIKCYFKRNFQSGEKSYSTRPVLLIIPRRAQIPMPNRTGTLNFQRRHA